MTRKIVYLCLCVWYCSLAWAGETIIRGTVTDAATGESLPYVSLLFKGTTIGTTTDLDGNFYFSSSRASDLLIVSYLGYTEQELTVRTDRTNTYHIELQPTAINLSEVVIKPGKERYSKKNNPAVEFIRNMIEHRGGGDPKSRDYYSYEQYQKMIFAMNDFEMKPPRADGKRRKFDFLVDFIDTLEVGTTVLPLSEKEVFEQVYYRSQPKSEKRVIQGMKSAGVDEIFSRDGVQHVLNEVFKEVDLFQNTIPLFLQRFVSPLSRIAPDFYKFYLLDTVEVRGEPCVDLGFVPFNSESFGFTGHLYVALDSTWFVKEAQLNVPKDINLNFVNRMTIYQSFERGPEGTRLLVKDDIHVDFKLTEKSNGMYARRLSLYDHHSFDPPADPQVYEQSAPVIALEDAYKRPEEYWESVRPAEAVKRNNNSVEELMARMRAVPLFYYAEKGLSLIINGYVQTNKDPLKSKFEIGPVNTFISANAIEGARFRLGGTTTTAFSRRLFLEGYAAYGTKDEKMKYNAIAEYSFIDKKEYRKEFPVHSIRLHINYDINQLGQQYMYTNKDNIFIALKRQKDTRATYLRNAELVYYREHYNGWGYGATLRNKKEWSTEYAAFDRIGSDGLLLPEKSYTMNEMELKLRFAPKEKFYQTRNYRYPITLDYPVITLSHVMAHKGLLGSSFTYNRTDLGIQKRFWLTPFGYIDVIGKAGKVWDKVPYPLLILPNANLSYTIQLESYTNMNAMEFISDEYVSWDLTYNMNGALLNRLPLIKKLQLREVLTFRGMYGNLTDKNNPFIAQSAEGLYAFPAGSMPLGSEPYMEMGVGVENIFKFLRLDYVWRLTYRDNPGVQNSGIRFMMRLSF